MAVCLRLRTLRQQAGLTQTQVAALLEVSREAYSMYESGKRQPGFDVLDILAAHYAVSVDYLLGRTECRALPQQVTPEEQQLLQQYRALDARGRHALDALLAAQLQYCAQQRPE